MHPISHTVTVACDQQRAFELFTTGMGSWWDPAYTPSPGTFTGIDLDARVDGAVALRHGEESYAFGEVLAWDPPRRYSQSFWLAMDAAHPSVLEVTFVAADNVCTVTLVHGGWTADNAASRSKYGDWPHLLGCYAQASARLG